MKRTFEGFEEITWHTQQLRNHLFIPYNINIIDYSALLSTKTTTKEDEKRFKKLNQLASKLIKDNNITFKY